MNDAENPLDKRDDDKSPETPAANVPIDPDPATINVTPRGRSPWPHTPRTKHLNLLGKNSIALYINNIDDPLIVQLGKGITLGRLVGLVTNPTVDLTPYNAFGLGVSRLHASIYPKDSDLLIEDLGSANGSSINNLRIAPHMPHKLQEGDLVSLGQLTLEVYFDVSEVSGALPTPPVGQTKTSPSASLSTSAVPESTTGTQRKEPAVAQPVEGTIQFSRSGLATTLQISARLVIHDTELLEPGKPPALKLVISAKLDETTPEGQQLIAKYASLNNFRLTLE